MLAWFLAGWLIRIIDADARRWYGDEILWNYFGMVIRYVVLIVGFARALDATGFPGQDPAQSSSIILTAVTVA